MSSPRHGSSHSAEPSLSLPAMSNGSGMVGGGNNGSGSVVGGSFPYLAEGKHSGDHSGVSVYDAEANMKSNMGNGGNAVERKDSKHKQQRRAILILTSVLVWCLVSNALVLLNRHILVELNFKCPVLLTSFGQMFTFFAVCVTRAVRPATVPDRDDVTPRFWILHCLPIGLFSCGTLALGQMPYYTLSVSYVQMLKAFTPVLTLLFSLMFRLEKFSWPLVLSVGIIAGGTGLAALGEINFAWGGTLFMLGSEVCEAMKLVLSQILLQGLAMAPMQSLYYMTPATISFLVFFSVTTESKLYVENALPIIINNPGLFTIAATLGFGVNLTSMAVVKLLSGLWLKIIVQVKGALLMLAGVLLLSDTITSLQLVGYGTTLVGFAYHTKLKMGSSITAALGSDDGDESAKLEEDSKVCVRSESEPLLDVSKHSSLSSTPGGSPSSG